MATDGLNDPEEDPLIAKWRFSRMLKELESSRGTATSMITLVIRPGGSISDEIKMLTNEYGAAENIKSRTNRQSVQSAIVSAQQRLKLYRQVPKNGLVLFVGTLDNDRKITFDLEPPQPLNTSSYKCDNRFHTESLKEMLDDNQKFGFIVMDGNGALFATLSGNVKTTLLRFEADLPKKHNKGGQSSVRFARLREEKRHNYLRKVTELAVQVFITRDLPNVKGLILAGSADFKSELAKTDMLDQRLRRIILKLVDTAYGEEAGLNQAIELSAEALEGVRYLEEKKLISSFFDEINRDTGKCCYGLRETLYALENGAVTDLLLWEDLPLNRCVVSSSSSSNETRIVYISTGNPGLSYPNQGKVAEGESIRESEPYVEWIARNYKNTGARLHLLSNRSAEGSQFCLGFSGIGGILRYKIDFDHLDGVPEARVEDDDDDPLDLGL